MEASKESDGNPGGQTGRLIVYSKDPGSAICQLSCRGSRVSERMYAKPVLDPWDSHPRPRCSVIHLRGSSRVADFKESLNNGHPAVLSGLLIFEC